MNYVILPGFYRHPSFIGMLIPIHTAFDLFIFPHFTYHDFNIQLALHHQNMNVLISLFQVCFMMYLNHKITPFNLKFPINLPLFRFVFHLIPNLNQESKNYVLIS